MNKKDAVQELACGYQCETIVPDETAPKFKPIAYRSVCTHAEVLDVNTGKTVRVKLGGERQPWTTYSLETHKCEPYDPPKGGAK